MGKFKRLLSPMIIKKNDFLLREGDKPKNISFVISGLFRAFYLTKNGEEKTIVFRSEGRVLSAYSSFVKNETSKFSIQALEDSIVLFLSIQDFNKILNEDKFWQVNMTKYYMDIFIEKEKRERELLSDDAQTRYLTFLDDYPGLEDRINHYYISSYLGISNVTLSRIRSKLSTLCS